jgi:hypothetical protein
LAQALVLGDKACILPMLEWLLQQRTLLEKRAYLAKFLMKVEIPTVLRGDASMEELHENVFIVFCFYYKFLKNPLNAMLFFKVNLL